MVQPSFCGALRFWKPIPHKHQKGEFLKKENFQNGCDERLPPPPCWQSALSRRLSSLPRPIRRLRAIAGCRGRAATLLQRRRRVAVPKIMSSRPQVPRAALQPRSMSPSAKQSSADARALAGGPRRGVVATARLDAREASAIMHDFLAGRFVCSLRHACLLANYSLQVTECLSALPSRWNCCPSPKSLMGRYR